jgi:hypothetical protein
MPAWAELLYLVAPVETLLATGRGRRHRSAPQRLPLGLLELSRLQRQRDPDFRRQLFGQMDRRTQARFHQSAAEVGAALLCQQRWWQRESSGAPRPTPHGYAGPRCPAANVSSHCSPSRVTPSRKPHAVEAVLWCAAASGGRCSTCFSSLPETGSSGPHRCPPHGSGSWSTRRGLPPTHGRMG